MTENDSPKAACEVGGEERAALTPTPAALGRECLGGEAMLGSGVGALPGPQLLCVCRQPARAWSLGSRASPVACVSRVPAASGSGGASTA